uniref:Desmoglein 2 n=1 Tax=Anas platyrhynchos platyrhynchos TaxID=8840 RepID=U3IJF7_ANAPP
MPRAPDVMLMFDLVFLQVYDRSGRSGMLSHPNSLVRQKREWTVPPAFIREEEDNSYRNPIARIHSDREDAGIVVTYTISGQGVTEPPYGLFVIDGKTGNLNITGKVDREKTPMLFLRGHALDKNGAKLEDPIDLPIKIVDINDNPPVFSHEVFVGSIEELSETGNVFFNYFFNCGFFRIVTDTKTNEGILTLVKELNYEEMQSLNLGVVVTNKAEFHKSIKNSYKAQTIPIKIKVINVREGPVFPGGTKIITASESLRVTQIIGQYQALDEDTGKISPHARAYVANWININTVTGEIQLAKSLDYESQHVVNGTYTFTMLDLPAKTVTGTVVIQVKDENDNCPIIENPVQTVCSDAKLIDVTASDLDNYPNSAPFTFTIIDEPEGTAKNWIIAYRNDTSVQLVPQNLKVGRSEVPLLIRDFQGLSCAQRQSLQLTVCTCAADGGCKDKLISNASVGLGPGAVALIILAFLLLLLLPLLLLLCPCGSGAKGFAAIPDCSEEMLRKWNSEGAAPEEKACFPNTAGAATGAAAAAGGGMSAEEAAACGGSSASNVRGHCSIVTREGWEEQRHLLSGADYHARAAAAGAVEGMAAGEGNVVAAGRGMAMGTAGAMNEEFLRDYFNDKAVSFAEEDEAQAARDCLLVYSQGESGSPHGSIGCCSFIEGDFDDHFLDDLGDKFKTLAEICIGRHIDMKDGSSRNESAFGVHDASSQLLNQQKAFSSKQAFSSGSHFSSVPPAQAGGGMGQEAVSQEVITETTFSSRSGQHDVCPHPTSYAETNVTMTETSYSAGGPAHPAAVFIDPQFSENVVVTERVLAPASSLQGMVEIPDLPSGSNVVVTERMVKSEGPRAGTMTVQDLTDSKYVVVRERERVLVPAGEQGSLSFPALSEGQSVVVNEKVLTTSGGAGRAERADGASAGRQEHVLITDSLLNQVGSAVEGAPPASSTLSKSSRVTKYSTVQYTRS